MNAPLQVKPFLPPPEEVWPDGEVVLHELLSGQKKRENLLLRDLYAILKHLSQQDQIDQIKLMRDIKLISRMLHAWLKRKGIRIS